MTTRGRWSVLALALTVAGLTACSNGCASANGGLYVGVRAAKTVNSGFSAKIVGRMCITGRRDQFSTCSAR